MPRCLQDLSILVVDDNPANTDLLHLMLEDEGFDHITTLNDARDVQACLQRAQQGELIDLLILDIRMPHIDGFGIMEMINSQYADLNIPVVVVTAEDANREQALHLGATDFITKPFQNWEVTLRINNALQNRLYYRQSLLRTGELEQQVRLRTNEVEATQQEIVKRLARAGEYRDNETGMHVLRMSHMCNHIARSLGCNDDFCDLLLQASPLHDVGKIGIPDHILLKPGRLTPEEREIMETHARIGHDILDGHDSELIQMAAEIALCHHEKWDGSGYPEGLRGEAIPLAARIAAICDVFDALLSARPYKEPWPLSRVVDLLSRESGLHFEPRIVSIFLQELDTLQTIRARFAETS
ncbi:MAG: response regulator [Marinobacterium sp.]|nr:response regulator [Marinobacterium sp.]